MRKDLGFKRIATEEAFATKDLIRAYRELLARKGSSDIGFNSLMGYYLTNPSERTRAVSERLQDLGARRIGDMDATGIDLQILSLTSPGVQIFDAATGTALARAINDELAAAIAAHPTRFAGLAAIAPQAHRRPLKDGGLQDIMPTLCQLMGLPVPAEVTGRSLLP